MFKNNVSKFLVLVIALMTFAFAMYYQTSDTVTLEKIKGWIHSELFQPTGVMFSGDADQQLGNPPAVIEVYNKSGSTVSIGMPLVFDATAITVVALHRDTATMTLANDLSGEEGNFHLVIRVDSVGTDATPDTGTVTIVGTNERGATITETITVCNYDGAGVAMILIGGKNLNYTSGNLWTALTSISTASLTTNSTCSLEVKAYGAWSVTTSSTAGEPKIVGTAVESIADEASGLMSLGGTLTVVLVDSTMGANIDVGSYLAQSSVAGYAKYTTNSDSAFAIATMPHRRGDGRSLITAIFIRPDKQYESQFIKGKGVFAAASRLAIYNALVDPGEVAVVSKYGTGSGPADSNMVRIYTKTDSIIILSFAVDDSTAKVTSDSIAYIILR